MKNIVIILKCTVVHFFLDFINFHKKTAKLVLELEGNQAQEKPRKCESIQSTFIFSFLFWVGDILAFLDRIHGPIRILIRIRSTA
jgi:hypothetical protein